MTDTTISDREAKLRALPGYVVLGRLKGGNAYQGVVEHSFSMGLSPSEACFFWSGTAYTGFGSLEIDGKKDAEHYRAHFAEGHPDMEFEVFDARDADALPVVIDWDRWVRVEMGGGRKYSRRNPSFEMK